jgi:epoxyqueuosine reductase
LSWLRQRIPEADGRVFVDTSPVMERRYGVAAGLGWIGHNCMLVNEKIGSFFLIAGLALNQDLKTDQAVPERCGDCRLCQDACPAGALKERRLDATRCTAYLTVEHRGPLPEDRRSGMGRWVAGCDLCQEICPWNSQERTQGVLQALLPREIALEELARLSDDDFRRLFGATPLARLKRDGLLRNVLLAMDARLPG